jgi:negative regulator of flagellin synthesis FlgM
MRVDQSKNQPQSSESSSAKHSGRATGADAKKTEKAGASGAEKAQSGARAEISSKGKEFAAVKAAAISSPDVREDRVADLKRKIADGSYKVDTDSIADHMVDDHLKMSGMS